MADSIRIEGLKEMQKSLEMTYKEMEDIVVKAMRSAARPVARQVKSRLGSEDFRFLVKSKVIRGRKTRSGYPTAVIGMFKSKVRKSDDDRTIPNWFKAYWKNYGTLSRRSPSHQFVKPIKPKSRGKQGGVMPRNFFDQALNSVDWQSKVRSGFKKNLIKQLDKMKQKAI